MNTSQFDDASVSTVRDFFTCCGSISPGAMTALATSRDSVPRQLQVSCCETPMVIQCLTDIVIEERFGYFTDGTAASFYLAISYAPTPEEIGQRVAGAWIDACHENPEFGVNVAHALADGIDASIEFLDPSVSRLKSLMGSMLPTVAKGAAVYLEDSGNLRPWSGDDLLAMVSKCLRKYSPRDLWRSELPRQMNRFLMSGKLGQTV